MEQNIEHNSYKGERESIEKLLEIACSERFVNEAAVAFFGLKNFTPEGDAENHEDLLTKDELLDFAIFFKHVAKRVVHAYSQKFNGIIKAHRDISVHEIGDLPEHERMFLFNALFHDLSHSVGQIAQNNNRTEISPVQPYLASKTNEVNVREQIEDELRGFIFGSLDYPSPYSNRTKLHLVENETFDEFVSNFFKKTLKAAEADNLTMIYEHSGHLRPDIAYEETRRQKDDLRGIIQDIKDNPPQDVLSSLSYVWNNRSNPRVLVDLFFIQIGPYIEKIKERKVYKDFSLIRENE